MSCSGAILGECPVCRELIWESQSWDMSNFGRITHVRCRSKRPMIQIPGVEIKREHMGDKLLLVIQKEVGWDYEDSR